MRKSRILPPVGLPGRLGPLGAVGMLGALALGVLGALALACDASNPVAPVGGGGTPAPATEFVVTVTAGSLTVFVGGSTQVTVSAVRADNGEPPDSGTNVSVSTNMGSFGGETLKTFVLDGSGKKTETFNAGDETGTAELLARLGDTTASLSLDIAPAPVAEFTWVADGLTVTFTDSSPGTPKSWNWIFGDGETSPQQNPVHPYAVSGTYEVELEVGYGEGVTSTASQSVEVAELPEAMFSWETSGLAVKFTDESMGGPTEWSWDFGDDGTSTKQNPGHTYKEAGTYVVGLEVKNAAGTSHRAEFLDVAEEPIASFSTSRNEREVIFTDTSKGSPTSWEWEFGDSMKTTSNAQNPIFDYQANGTFAVTLTVSNLGGGATVSCFVCVDTMAGSTACPSTTVCPAASP